MVAIPKQTRAGRLFAMLLALMAGVSAQLICAPEADARKHHASAHAVKTHHGHLKKGISANRSKHHSKHHTASAPKTRYAYPIDFFMMSPPAFDMTPMADGEAGRLKSCFENGVADRYSAAQLVRGGVFRYHPIRGGIFKRREQVKYIVVHSTESGVPQDAVHVIEAWSSMGRRHPGAQFCVDRDGTIWQACDPDLATVHVNIFKTLPGINNDNTIGIEMCHAGAQTYTAEQKQSVIRLVSYLQDRYRVVSENIITHKYAQQGDHTDPVNFDWDGFLAHQGAFHNKALAMKHDLGQPDEQELEEVPAPPVASVYLEMHKYLSLEDVLKSENLKSKINSNQQALTHPVSRLRPSTMEAPTQPRPVTQDIEYNARPRQSMTKAAIRDEIELTPGNAIGQ